MQQKNKTAQNKNILKITSFNVRGSVQHIAGKLISLFISMSFIFPFLTWAFETKAYASQPMVLFDRQQVDIPRVMGTVIQAHQGNERLVILVQDLHCNYEVQKNIADIIDQCRRQYGLRIVGVEGAAARVCVDELADFPLAPVRQQTADYLLRQGKITGPEFWAVLNKNALCLQGVEDQALYDSNRAAVKAFLNEESQGYICDLRDTLQELKKGLYSPALLALDEQQQSFRANTLSLPLYAGRLARHARQRGLSLQSYPQLQVYLSGLGRNRSSAEADPEALATELDGLDRELRAGLYTDQAQAELDDWQARLDIIEKLLNISATARDLAMVRQRPRDFTTRAFAAYLARQAGARELSLDADLERLDGYVDQARDFYAVADQRSQAFVRNLLASMQRQGAGLAMLVTGGYHTEEIAADLQRRGVSYISVRPALKQPDVYNPYFSLLRGQRLPLEKLLAKNQNIFSLPTNWRTGNAAAAADALFSPLVRQVAGIFTLGQAVLNEKLSAAADVPAYYQKNMASYLAANQGLSLQWIETQGREAIAAFANGITVKLSSGRLANRAAAVAEELSLPNGRAEVMSNPMTRAEAGRRLSGAFPLAWLDRLWAGAETRVRESSGQGIQRALKASEGGFLASFTALALFNLPEIYFSLQNMEGQALFATTAGMILGSLFFVIYYSAKAAEVDQAYAKDSPEQGFIEPLQAYKSFIPDAAGRKRQVLDQVEDGAIKLAEPVRFLNKYLQYTIYAHILLHNRLHLPEKAAYLLELPVGALAAFWWEAVRPVINGPASHDPLTMAKKTRRSLERKYNLRLSGLSRSTEIAIFTQNDAALEQKIQLWVEQGITPHPLFLSASRAETALLIPIFKQEWSKTLNARIRAALTAAAEQKTGERAAAATEPWVSSAELPESFLGLLRAAGLQPESFHEKYSLETINQAASRIRAEWESVRKSSYAGAKTQVNNFFLQARSVYKVIAEGNGISAEDAARKLALPAAEAGRTLDFLTSSLAERTELAGVDKKRNSHGVVYYQAWKEGGSEQAHAAIQQKKHLAEKYGITFADWSTAGAVGIFNQDAAELEWKIQELMGYNLDPHPLLLSQTREDLLRVIPRIKAAQQNAVLEIFAKAVEQSENYVQGVGLGVVGSYKKWPSRLQERLQRYGVNLPGNLTEVTSLVCNQASPLIEEQLNKYENSMAGLYGRCLRQIAAEDSYVSRAYRAIMAGNPLTEKSFHLGHGLNTSPETTRLALEYLASPAAQHTRRAGVSRKRGASGEWVYYRMGTYEQQWNRISNRLRELSQLPGYLLPVMPLDPGKTHTAFSARTGYAAAAAAGLASLPVWGIVFLSIQALAGPENYLLALIPLVVSMALGAYLVLAAYEYADLAVSVQRAVYRNFLQPSQSSLTLREKTLLIWQSFGFPVAANGRYRYELALKALPDKTRARIEQYQKYQQSLLGLVMLLPGGFRWEQGLTAWIYRQTFDPRLGRLVSREVRSIQQQRYLEAKYGVRFPEVLPATRDAVFSQDLGKLEDNLGLWRQYGITPHPLMLNREHDLIHAAIPVFLRLQKNAVMDIYTRALRTAQERQLYQAGAARSPHGPRITNLQGDFLAPLRQYGIPEQIFINSYTADVLTDALKEILPAVAAIEAQQVGTYAQAISQAPAIQRVSDPIRKLLALKGELTSEEVAEAVLISPWLAAQALESLCSPAAEDSPWPGVDKKRQDDGSVVYYLSWTNSDPDHFRQAARAKKYLAEKYGLVFANWAEARLANVFSQDQQELEAKIRGLLVNNLEPHPLLLARPLAELARVIPMILEEQKRAVLEIFGESVIAVENNILGVGLGVKGMPEAWPAGMQKILLRYGVRLPSEMEKISPTIADLAAPAIRKQIDGLEKSMIGLYAKVFFQFGMQQKYTSMAYDQIILEDKTLTALEFNNQHLMPPDYADMVLEFLASAEAEKSEDWGGVAKFKGKEGWVYHRVWRPQDAALAHKLIMEGQELTSESLAQVIQARAPYRLVHAQLALEYLISTEAQQSKDWSGIGRRQNPDQSWTYTRSWRYKDVDAARNLMIKGKKLTVKEFAQQADINEPLAALALEHLAAPKTRISQNWGGMNRKQNAAGEWEYYRMGLLERARFMIENKLVRLWLDRQMVYLQTPPPILLVLPGSGKRGGGLWAFGLVGLAFWSMLPKAAAQASNEIAGAASFIPAGAGLSLTAVAPALILGLVAGWTLFTLIKLRRQQPAEQSKETVKSTAGDNLESGTAVAPQPVVEVLAGEQSREASSPALAAGEKAGYEYNVPQLQRSWLPFRWFPALHRAWMFLLAGIFAVAGYRAEAAVTVSQTNDIVFLQELKQHCVPETTAEIFRMGRVGFAPLAAKPGAAGLAAWFLGAFSDNTKLGTAEPGNDLVFYLPSSLLSALYRGQEAPNENWGARLAKSLARQMVLYQSRRYHQNSLANHLALGHIDQALDQANALPERVGPIATLQATADFLDSVEGELRLPMVALAGLVTEALLQTEAVTGQAVDDALDLSSVWQGQWLQRGGRASAQALLSAAGGAQDALTRVVHGQWQQAAAKDKSLQGAWAVWALQIRLATRNEGRRQARQQAAQTQVQAHQDIQAVAWTGKLSDGEAKALLNLVSAARKVLAEKAAQAAGLEQRLQTLESVLYAMTQGQQPSPEQARILAGAMEQSLEQAVELGQTAEQKEPRFNVVAGLEATESGDVKPVIVNVSSKSAPDVSLVRQQAQAGKLPLGSERFAGSAEAPQPIMAIAPVAAMQAVQTLARVQAVGIRLPARVSVWLETLAMRLHPAAYVSQAAKEIPEALLLDDSVSSQELQALRNSDPAAVAAYLNRNDVPLALAVRGFVHGTRLGQRELGETLARLLPRQAASQEAQARGLLRLSEFTQRLRSLPGLAIGTLESGHAAWANLDLKSLASQEVAVPAALVSARGAKNVLGFVLDQMDWSEAFARNQRALQLFLRRGLQRFGGAA